MNSDKTERDCRGCGKYNTVKKVIGTCDGCNYEEENCPCGD